MDPFGSKRRSLSNPLFFDRHFKDIGFVGSITYGTKVRQNSFMDRLKGRYIIFLRKFYIFANRFHKMPKPVKRLGKKMMRAVQ